ncbi:MAG TPA: winged helix-turn-helix domain-containing protein, partial [Jiangellales bacterium]|nr:winged helix-turn-helix domain-containing protein [Jiangellales bacterium]
MIEDSAALRFGILGPLCVAAGTQPVLIGGVRSQSILAALLLDANRVVSVPQLVEAAWGEDPPRGALTQVRNRVSALRRILRSAW